MDDSESSDSISSTDVMQMALMYAGSMKKTLEIDALIGMLSGAEKVMEVTTDIVLSHIDGKQGSTGHQMTAMMNDSYRTLLHGFETYVEAKKRRIEIYIEELKKYIPQTVVPYPKKLEEINQRYDIIKKNIDQFTIKPIGRMQKKEVIDLTNNFKKNMLTNTAPTIKEYDDLEALLAKHLLDLIEWASKKIDPVKGYQVYHSLTNNVWK